VVKIRQVAIYLPQFHPIPENDEWWGKGFTEWTNVVKARPLFDGHYQPQLPADLGFYDLRLPEIMQQQANLAGQYGIEGFCFYHYWFNGKKLLQRPVEEMLASGKPDFPFMLCWANENWTRKWDGRDQEVLMEQCHSEDDDVNHIHHLIQFFKDPRYIRVDNKPVFIIYKSFLLPDPAATAKKWREIAAQHGMELYLCHMVFRYNKTYSDLADGFDAAIDFEPFGTRRTESNLTRTKTEVSDRSSIVKRISGRFKKANPGALEQLKTLNIKEYKSMFENLKPLKESNCKIFPSLVPGWDNTARKPNDPVLILNNSTPALFKEWLEKIVRDFKPYSVQENFVFINAWNEWAEGNHLEPCARWGLQYLEALKSVVEK
jgi:lipopolysaccharide biosynthesis protein